MKALCRIPLAAALFLCLTAGMCVSATPEPVAVVPAGLARPACRPPADLMVRPVVPRVVAGEPMPERAARDGTWMTTTARDFFALQRWIVGQCQ